ncbi:MAG: hypothetical protein JJ953_11735 [Gracilimonas sp.]|uniref:hypothetical protein n=1 Tax=Gracilimonas sp. TaxID=1974203 RepID=UPI001B2C6664|nr:hypothetical protein [Gracilimonas sp.]MBO6586769.1 hypothetical protein [Gracilimonas sp.]MBO6615426.1 hypothetical protein [Gracilimonas sp.]
MSKTEYKKYKDRLVQEYKQDKSISINAISRREKKNGIVLHVDRLRRWITSAGVEIRPARIARRKYEQGGVTRTFYIKKSQSEKLDEYTNSSDLVRIALDIILGNPIDSIVCRMAAE